jgi:hypothetical protein
MDFGKRRRSRRRYGFGNGGNPPLNASMGYEFCSNGGGVLGANSTGLFPSPCMGGAMKPGDYSSGSGTPPVNQDVMGSFKDKKMLYEPVATSFRNPGAVVTPGFVTKMTFGKRSRR